VNSVGQKLQRNKKNMRKLSLLVCKRKWAKKNLHREPSTKIRIGKREEEKGKNAAWFYKLGSTSSKKREGIRKKEKSETAGSDLEQKIKDPWRAEEKELSILPFYQRPARGQKGNGGKIFKKAKKKMESKVNKKRKKKKGEGKGNPSFLSHRRKREKAGKTREEGQSTATEERPGKDERKKRRGDRIQKNPAARVKEPSPQHKPMTA